MAHDVVQLFAACIAFDQHLHADVLEAHLAGLALCPASTPGGGVADVTFEEDFQPGQLDLAVGCDSGDANAQAAAEARQDDFPGGGSGVLAEQVQRLIDDDRRMVADIAEGAVFAVHDGVDLVRAAGVGVVAAALGKGFEAITVDGTEIGFHRRLGDFSCAFRGGDGHSRLHSVLLTTLLMQSPCQSAITSNPTS
ncbi:hypothetical protein SDC9_94966 [bioreactor metagenome]|uniref:Uncharacterized protein n=1 Tax=bioreactor metagenome TaxID=1076179 RepID=A0A645A584_9ZZZZ